MSLKICRYCSHHYVATEITCPHCSLLSTRSKKGLGLALLLGISAVACGEKGEDTAADTAEDTATDPVPEPSASDLYGVPEEESDIDTWTED